MLDFDLPTTVENRRNAVTGVINEGKGAPPAGVDFHASLHNNANAAINSLGAITGIETGPVLQALGTPAIVDNGGRNICHLSNDGKYLVANKRTMLRISSNESGGWTDCHEFTDSVEHLVELNNGEVLVFTGPDATKQGKVFRSSGWSWTNPTAATWSEVKKSNGVGAYFTATYGGIFYDYDKGVLVLSEYGNKTGTEVGSARYVYCSLDNGTTWATIFDRQTYDGGGAGKHMHGCAYDAVWDRVWLTLGDDTNAIVYSDDWRNVTPTWSTAQSDASVNGKYQSVAIVPLPKCILFGSDGWPNGIHRIMRADKNGASTKANPGAALESAYAMNAKGTLTHLFQQPFVARHVSDAPLLWPYGISGSPAPPVCGLIASFDGGLTFTEIWRDSIPYTADGAFKVAVGPTQQNGKILGTLDDGRQANWSKITFTGTPDRRRAALASHHHQHYRGGEDAIHPGGIRAAWGHHVIAPADPVSGGGPTALTANQPRGVRVVVPCRGHLRDLSAFIGTAGDGSTIYYDLAVYKELSTGYQWLWSKGKTLLPNKTSAESGEATILGDPVYPVEVGDELIFELVCSSATPTFRTYANAPAVPLPKSFNPLSTATYKRVVQFSGSSAVLPLPAANAGEPSIAVPNAETSGAISSAPLIFGRIAPTYA